MKRITLALGTLLLAASAAGAQSAPNIMKPKQVAARAVAATNAAVAANSTLPAEPGEPDEPGEAGGQAVRARALPASNTAGSPVVDSGAGSAESPETKAAPAAAFRRETFSYDRSGRRDPFVSLMSTSELRPGVSDLRLVGVAYDASGGNSVAMLRDLGTKDQYRIRVGQTLGRMRVSAITPRAVVFTIEEFGYSRQETLALGDSNKERKQ
ncbi:MAG: hypothetical protein ABIZ91_15220 [Gemmatimonadaceae bacterium]